MSGANHRSLTVGTLEQGERLDRLLSLHFSDLSRSRFKDLIKAGNATVDGVTNAEPNYRVSAGEVIGITVPEPEPAVPQAESIPLDVLYEDHALIVINKPAGLVVHPAAGNWSGTLVNALIAHCGDSLSGIGGVRRPGIVHRLDKETSGVMVVAKTDPAHRGLSDQFAAHGADGRMQRIYEAYVWGVPERRQGSIDANLGRKGTNRQKMAVLRDGGKHAVTHYRVTETFPGGTDDPIVAKVECRLETGRTHQIRVHMAHLGHPLLGDVTYGAGFAASATKLSAKAAEALAKLKRQALHARVLAFEHPESGKKMRFEAEPPADLCALANALETWHSP